MRKFRKKIFLMIGFLEHLIITPYQFGAFLMPLRPLFNQTEPPLSPLALRHTSYHAYDVIWSRFLEFLCGDPFEKLSIETSGFQINPLSISIGRF